MEHSLDTALQQAIKVIHGGSVTSIERKLNIGGTEYNANIYKSEPGVIRIDIMVKTNILKEKKYVPFIPTRRTL